MNSRTICTTLLACLALAMVVHAATRQWSYVTPSLPYQLTSDGKGGCAFVWVATNNVPTVVWLDKNGTVKYEKALPPTMYPFALAQVSRKMIAYITGSGGNYSLVQVDKKGQESTTAGAAALAFAGGYPYPFSRPYDKKGFFVIEAKTNVVPNTFEIVRYSNK